MGKYNDTCQAIVLFCGNWQGGGKDIARYSSILAVFTGVISQKYKLLAERDSQYVI